jgi:hypothetical protein
MMQGRTKYETVMDHPKPASAPDHLIAHRWQPGPAKRYRNQPAHIALQNGL